MGTKRAGSMTLIILLHRGSVAARTGTMKGPSLTCCSASSLADHTSQVAPGQCRLNRLGAPIHAAQCPRSCCVLWSSKRCSSRLVSSFPSPLADLRAPAVDMSASELRHRDPPANSAACKDVPSDGPNSSSSYVTSYEESRRDVPWQTDNEYLTHGWRRQVGWKGVGWSLIGCALVLNVVAVIEAEMPPHRPPQ